jgi:hypothetical protein
VRPGVVSMAHARGDLPELDGQVRTIGSSTARLVSVERDFEPISGIPRQSAIPVNVRTLDPGELATIAAERYFPSPYCRRDGLRRIVQPG